MCLFYKHAGRQGRQRIRAALWAPPTTLLDLKLDEEEYHTVKTLAAISFNRGLSIYASLKLHPPVQWIVLSENQGGFRFPP